MLVGFVLTSAVIITVAVAVFANRPAPPPQIQGLLLTEASPLPTFKLLNHRGEPFSNRDLQGRWHLVSYGFTTCPDICPTTLAQLSLLVAKLEDRADDLEILFYTVDYQRDTSEQLAAYLPFFNKAFVGLTHLDDPKNPHLPFEQGLGIAARLVPGNAPNSSDYQVLHGNTLFLLNPQGELQAIFQPGNSEGAYSFDPDKLAEDYLAIRQYLAD